MLRRILVKVLLCYLLLRLVNINCQTFKDVQVVLIDLNFEHEVLPRRSYKNLQEVIHNKELFALRIEKENIPTLPVSSVADVKRINRVELERDNISYIAPGAFANLSKVFISLKNNYLQKIEEHVFSGVLGITGLDLDGNHITQIQPRAFNNMPNLTVLILSNNKLTYWSSSWVTGSPVGSLWMVNNNLAEIPTNAFLFLHYKHDNRNMEFLDFTNSHITSVPENCLNGVKKIKYFYLGKNRLETIPENLFLGLEEVKYLSLRENRLKCLPHNVDKIMNVVGTVDLNGNPITCDCKNMLQNWLSTHKNKTIVLPKGTCVVVP